MPSSRSTWFVTGSSRGLGRAIAQAAIDRGDDVVATARDPRALDDLVAQAPDRVRAVALDVTDPEAANLALKAAVAAFGRIDVVVNNAGYANSAPIEEMDPADFRAQVDANFYGVVNVTARGAAGPARAARRHVRAGLVGRRPRRRDARHGRLPGGEVRGRGLLRGPRRRGRAVRRARR